MENLEYSDTSKRPDAPKYKPGLVTALVIAVIFFYSGFQAGKGSVPMSVRGIDNVTEGQPENVDFAAFWRAWNVINEKYVPASTTVGMVSDQEKVWGAIKGLTASLGDPYTVFFPPAESKLFEADIRGNFEGVGMEIVAQEEAITIIAPLRGSPAEKAGLLPGDKVIRIDGRDTSRITTEEAVQLIRGPKGTSVVLSIFRANSEPFNVTLVRDVINIPTIATRSLGNDIFLIELYNFSANSPNLFRSALREFIISGDEKLILDLRGNPGGYLEASIDMASWFLPTGRVIVREDFGGTRTEKVYRSKGYDIFNEKLDFVILLDGGSASASEILAGALREHNRAIIVGEKTFGKGSVQELVNITPETSLKVTIARWLTPNGLSISSEGITPDIAVERTIDDIKAGRDHQLEKAIEILRN
jgi:carboxyl-terminal processing protease